MRDQAPRFEAHHCVIFGISFDTPAENRAFREEHDFGFALLCDTDRAVGEAYGAKRPAGHEYEAVPKRISFLIDPDGIVQRVYEVTDTAGHADEVLADLDELDAH